MPIWLAEHGVGETSCKRVLEVRLPVEQRLDLFQIAARSLTERLSGRITHLVPCRRNTLLSCGENEQIIPGAHLAAVVRAISGSCRHSALWRPCDEGLARRSLPGVRSRCWRTRSARQP